jgi:hypothetical protein
MCRVRRVHREQVLNGAHGDPSPSAILPEATQARQVRLWGQEGACLGSRRCCSQDQEARPTTVSNLVGKIFVLQIF